MWWCCAMKATQSTFLGLEITKSRKGFEVKNSTEFVDSLLNLYGLENSKPTANPGGRSTVMELASAPPLDGHQYSNFRTAVGKLIFMAPWKPDMQFAIQQLSTKVVNPTTESKRAVKQLIRYLKGTQNTCLRIEPREMVQKGLLELLGRSDSDCADDSATGQSVTGYHYDVQNDKVQPESETDSDQSQFMRNRVLRSQCLPENCWDSQNSSRNFTTKFQFVSKWIQTRQDIPQRRGSGGLKHIETRCLAIQQWIREKRLSVSRVDTKNNTADLFTKHLDGLRTQSLAKKLGLRILDGTNGMNGMTEEWWRLRAFEKRLQSSRSVSFLSFNNWQNVNYIDIDLCTLTSFLPCMFFFFLACPQTDTDQLYNTQPDFRARTSGSNKPWVNRVFRNMCSQTVILYPYRRRERWIWKFNRIMQRLHTFSEPSRFWGQTLENTQRSDQFLKSRLSVILTKFRFPQQLDQCVGGHLQRTATWMSYDTKIQNVLQKTLEEANYGDTQKINAEQPPVQSRSHAVHPMTTFLFMKKMGRHHCEWVQPQILYGQYLTARTHAHFFSWCTSHVTVAQGPTGSRRFVCAPQKSFLHRSCRCWVFLRLLSLVCSHHFPFHRQHQRPLLRNQLESYWTPVLFRSVMDSLAVWLVRS